MRILLLVPVFAVSTAYAGPSLSERETTTSYRFETLLVDGLSVGTFFLGLATDQSNKLRDPLLVAGASGGLLAAPLIHGLRGHSGRAGGSLALRTAGVVVGAGIGVAAADGCAPSDGSCNDLRAGLGLLSGFLVASAIDAAMMTDELEHRPAQTSRWVPVITPRSNGGTFGVAASF